MAEIKNDIRDWVIYKLTSPSGKNYVGKSVNLKGRLSNYRTLNCPSQPLLYRSLKKYGFNNHKLEIIDSFSGNNSYANGKEMFWIRTCMSHTSKWRKLYGCGGLNLTDGAEGMTGYKYSDESKKKMSLKSKGRPNKYKGVPLSAEHRKKISDKAIGRVSPNIGKKYSDERKKNIGLSKIGNTNMLGKNHSDYSKDKIAATRLERYGKPIIQFDLHGNYIKEYDGVRRASRETGIDRTTIGRIVKGVIKNPTKFIFKYKTI